MLKIITGTAKGRILKTLEGEATRPTSERIKEAVFSSIQFDIEDRRVLDLFAGCGQLADIGHLDTAFGHQLGVSCGTGGGADGGCYSSPGAVG